MSNVIHARHLKKYSPSPQHFGLRATLPNPGWEDLEAERYEVDRIVVHRQNQSKKLLEYLTRWLRDAPAVLLDYRQAHHI
ncbi:hypothetical protein AURDEDRAFT_174805 [Auricularia subglabra TFB-10046 SS5]|nr:hypothetical protein AURDEDRAFT_174805 [Auricularia subglabra TFB-10046 SS5]